MPVLSSNTMIITGLSVMFLTISAVVYYVLRTRSQTAVIRAGLDDALAATSPTEVRSDNMEVPFSKRVMGPSARNLAGVVYRFGPKGMAEKTRKRLVTAGLADKLEPDSFYALSLAIPLGMFGLLFLLKLSGNGFSWPVWAMAASTPYLPKMWLTRKVEARQREIRRALADTLDLMTIAVEAGLGFDAALGRVVGAIKGPLSDELFRMLQELRIGIPRNAALTNLAARTNVEELDQFITAIHQADSFGIAIGKVLRVQAQQLRQKRSQLAEERAAKTPVKLLFPLLLCVFPALFVVLVGPAAISIAHSMSGL
jgi:tight adherence protein C